MLVGVSGLKSQFGWYRGSSSRPEADGSFYLFECEVI